MKISYTTVQEMISVEYLICIPGLNSIFVLTLLAFIKDEILEVAGKIYKAGMSLLVIDTENKFVSTGFAKEIARVAQGLLAKVPITSLE